MTDSFTELLRTQGYIVKEFTAKGGNVNHVRFIIAKKGDRLFEYVLKTYSNENDVNDMMRGYDVLTSVVNIPSIVYHQGNEVAYDKVQGKSLRAMIEQNDPSVKVALLLLARNLHALHNKKKEPAHYPDGNSPDEKNMMNYITRALASKYITQEQSRKILNRIMRYIPRQESFIHGDAHLDNFLYDGQDLYFIDPDRVKRSDPNADLGKVTYDLEKLAKLGKITQHQARELHNLFLDEYEGEDRWAIELHKLRTPLIVINNKAKMKTLERKIALGTLIGISLLLTVTIEGNITGHIIKDTTTDDVVLMSLLMTIVSISVFVLLKWRAYKGKIT